MTTVRHGAVVDPDTAMSVDDSPDSSADSDRAWYDAGLRFECSQCGNCCSGPPGAVWFTPEEGRLIAARLGVSEADFLERYTRRVGVRRTFNERESDIGFDCVFLDRLSVPGRASCSIYDLRPTQCRTWPFWPENLASPQAWTQAKAMMPCHGMDHGRLHSFVEIRVQVDRDRKATPFSPESERG